MTKQIIRMSDVVAKTGLARNTIYRLIGAGQFPVGIPLGLRAVGWLLSDIDAWIDNRVKNSKARG